MLILKGHATTPDKLKMTHSATGDLDTVVSYGDEDNSLLPAASIINFDSEYHTFTTAGTNDICAGITNANHRRNIKHVSIRNVHATVTNEVTVIVDAIDGNDYEEIKTTLLAGERLGFDDGVGWFKTANTSSNPVLFNASSADQVTGVADVYLTNSNILIGGRLKVGTFFRWMLNASKTAASTATPIMIMRFGTAGAIGDTARCTMTGPAQTGVVDEGLIIVEGVVRAHGSATGVVRGAVATVHRAASAAGFGNFCAAATSAAFDTTVAGLQVGLSFTGGTAAAWTFQVVQAEAFNLTA